MQPAAQAAVELVVLRAVRVQSVGERRERCSVKQRDIRSAGELGSDAGASRALLSRDRPEVIRQAFLLLS